MESTNQAAFNALQLYKYTRGEINLEDLESAAVGYASHTYGPLDGLDGLLVIGGKGECHAVSVLTRFIGRFMHSAFIEAVSEMQWDDC